MDRAAPQRLQKPAGPILLVAVDLDGTLLDDTKRVSAPTLRALGELSDNRVKLVIASARPPRSVRHIYAQLKLDTLQINYNGALIWDETHRRVVYHCPMDGALTRRIIEQARALEPGVLVSCEILDRWHTDRHDPGLTTETGRLLAPDVIAPVQTFWEMPATKVLLLGEPRLILRLDEVLAQAYSHQAIIFRSDGDTLLQIMDRRVGKASALRRVAEHYRVPMGQVMAIGDAPNDVGMLQVSGVAVAMDNAHPIVKATADWVAPSNNDHGVHAALRRYGLCG